MARFVNLDQLLDEVLPAYAKSTVYTMVSRREIPFHKKAGKLLFDVDEVASWVREGSPEEAPPPWRRDKRR